MTMRALLWMLAGVGIAVLAVANILALTTLLSIGETNRANIIETNEAGEAAAQAAKEAVRAAAEAEAGTDRIIDCTSPGGKCFERGARRTADLLGTPAGPINTVVVYAAACATALPLGLAPAERVDRTEVCVTDRLEADRVALGGES